MRRESGEKPGTCETNEVTRSSVNRPEQALNRNLSMISYGHLDGLKENANDAPIPKVLDSPILRPVTPNLPILPARQEMTLEKTTGYGRGRLRRERPESEVVRKWTRYSRMWKRPSSKQPNEKLKILLRAGVRVSPNRRYRVNT